MPKTINGHDLLAALADEGYNLVVQKEGGAPGDETQPQTYIPLTAFMDFLAAGATKTYRTFIEETFGVHDSNILDVVGGMAHSDYADPASPGADPIPGILVLGSDFESGEIVGLRPIKIAGSVTNLQSDTIQFENIPGAGTAGAILKLDPIAGYSVYADPPPPPAQPPEQQTSIADHDGSAAPGTWIEILTPNALVPTFSVNANLGDFTCRVRVVNDQTQSQRSGTIQFGVDINNAAPTNPLYKSQVFPIASLYDGDIAAVFPITANYTFGQDCRLYANVTNDHANTNINVMGSVNNTVLQISHD